MVLQLQITETCDILQPTDNVGGRDITRHCAAPTLFDYSQWILFQIFLNYTFVAFTSLPLISQVSAQFMPCRCSPSSSFRSGYGRVSHFIAVLLLLSMSRLANWSVSFMSFTVHVEQYEFCVVGNNLSSLSSSSYWCYSLVPAVITRKDASPFHSFRCFGFPVVNLCIDSCWVICSHSVGFPDNILQGEEVSLTPNHRPVDQASVFMSPGEGWSSCAPGYPRQSPRTTRVINLWSTGIYRPIPNFGFRQKIGVGVYNVYLLLPMQLGVRVERVEWALSLNSK